MKSFFKILLSPLFLTAGLLTVSTSCNDGIESPDITQPNDGDYVSVKINLNSGSLVNLTPASPATRAAVSSDEAIVCEMLPDTTKRSRAAMGIDDPVETAETKIMNLWVLQYDGTGNSAKLVTSAYIDDYQMNQTAKLIASTTENTIVFIANTFDNTIPFPINSTISELKARRFTTQSFGTIVVKNPNTASVGDTEDFPNDGDYYQRLNGKLVTTIEEGNTLTATLQHNACRISLNVTNNTAGKANPVTLKTADIEHVPGCMYFFTDYDNYTSGNSIGKPTMTDIGLYGLKNYANIIKWSDIEGTSTEVKSAKFYLPANESGVVASNTNPKLKSLFSPSRATIIRLRGTYHDSEQNADIPITYSLALGEDMVKNYQLVPNGDYVYNITINARGDKTTDGRVSYGSANGIDYTDLASWPLSNCYICNPPTTGEATYKIPVARVDQFWGGGNYENEPNNCLGAGNAWTVEVIWSDMLIDDTNFKITKHSGNGKNDYFEVSVPSTSVMGNVILGIKNANTPGGQYLWSWHLWITDYCPDEAKYLTQQNAFLAGTDTYHVTGGDVQRYSIASSGTVQKVYMDRSIGILDPKATGSNTRGVMFYQFGRKDPFPGGSPEFYQEGTNKQNYVIKTRKYDETSDRQPQNVPYSVSYPTTFITGNNDASMGWTINDKYNPSIFNCNIIWNDPSASNNGGKSIFDPSPSGWKIPAVYEVRAFNSMIGNVIYASTYISDGSVSFPHYTFRNSKGSIQGGAFCNLWNYSSYSNYQALSFSMQWDSFNKNAKAGGWGDSNMACGFVIRPVQE